MVTSRDLPARTDGLGAAVAEAANVDRERTALDPFVAVLRTFAIVATTVVALAVVAWAIALTVARRRRTDP
jgi:anti-sigma-K factor RskA